jgi:hypothetical protein
MISLIVIPADPAGCEAYARVGLARNIMRARPTPRPAQKQGGHRRADGRPVGADRGDRGDRRVPAHRPRHHFEVMDPSLVLSCSASPQGLQDIYFKDRGRSAADLEVEFTDIDYIELDF